MTIYTPSGKPFRIVLTVDDYKLQSHNYYFAMSTNGFRCPDISCGDCEFSNHTSVCTTKMLEFLRPTLAEHYPEILI